MSRVLNFPSQRPAKQWIATARHVAGVVAVTITHWEPNQLGVAYDYSDGHSADHPIGPSDWPIIRAHARCGTLHYADDEVRDMAESYLGNHHGPR